MVIPLNLSLRLGLFHYLLKSQNSPDYINTMDTSRKNKIIAYKQIITNIDDQPVLQTYTIFIAKGYIRVDIICQIK